MNLEEIPTKDLLDELKERCGMYSYHFIERNGGKSPILYAACAPGDARAFEQVRAIFHAYYQTTEAVKSIAELRSINIVWPDGRPVDAKD